MISYIRLILLFSLLPLAGAGWGQTITLDTTFNPGAGFNAPVGCMALQSDGKIYCGGSFITYNGISRARIARLNSNGTLDSSFNPGLGFDHVRNPPSFYDGVWTLTLQADGKLLCGGGFTSFNGVSRSGIARLNSNGTLDATFSPGMGFEGFVYSLALQADGKLLCGGGFTSFNGIQRNCIARLNANGTLDASFNPGSGFNADVSCIALQSDGKLICGGVFDTFNGRRRYNILRLNANGSLDSTFHCRADNGVNRLVLQSDGKIICGGSFENINGIARKCIARIHMDGTLDTTFNPGTGFDLPLYSLTLQSDGKLLCGGSFSVFNGIGHNYLIRLNVNGTLDTTFDCSTNFDQGVSGTIIQPDGRLICGGSFMNFNGVPRSGVVRLLVPNFPVTLHSKSLLISPPWPNPIQPGQIVHFPFNPKDGKASITLTDPLGRTTVLEGWTEGLTLNSTLPSALLPGVYGVQIAGKRLGRLMVE